MNQPQRLIVVGGGVFGACIAYELAKSGLSVTVLEKDAIGSHASGKNPGNLNPILAAPPRLRPFALASFYRHQSLQEELRQLGCRDYQVERVRRLMVCFNDNDRQELAPIEPLFNAMTDFSARWLNRDEVMTIEPRLNPDIQAALLLEGNLSLDARAFNHALIEGAIRYGASLQTTEFLGFSRNKRGYTIETRAGKINGDAIVFANGHWIARYHDWLGFDLPVQPVKGEMMRLRLPDSNISHDLTLGLISLYHRGEDEVWLGVTREDGVSDEIPSAAGRQLLMEGASHILPCIRDATCIEHLASVRPMAPGALPIIDRVPGYDHIYIANGGGIKGVLCSAGVGKAVADLMLEGNTDLPIAHFSLERNSS